MTKKKVVIAVVSVLAISAVLIPLGIEIVPFVLGLAVGTVLVVLIALRVRRRAEQQAISGESEGMR